MTSAYFNLSSKYTIVLYLISLVMISTPQLQRIGNLKFSKIKVSMRNYFLLIII